MGRVTAIVLHWGDPAITAKCLESLRRSAVHGLDVLVIDNGTPDRGGERLARDFPMFTHLRNEANLGFAGGNNVGLRRALDSGAEFALLLNNDTEVRPGAIEALVAAAEADPRIGMVNPKILHHEPRGLIWFAGGRHSLWTGQVRHLGRGEGDRGQWDRPGPQSFATGCALLVRRATLEQIGLLDESLFMYAEDLDWSLRARRAGWTLWFEPRAAVTHREAVLRRKTVPDPFRLRLATRNALRVNWRHGHWAQRVTSTLWFCVRWLGYLSVKNLLLGFPGDVAALWAGVFDAVRRRTGP